MVGRSDSHRSVVKSLTDGLEIARLSLGQEADFPPPPPPPPLVDTKSSGVIAVDITAKFSEAVKSASSSASPTVL